MSDPRDLELCGVVLLTESNRAHEWPWLLGVIRNRMADARRFGGGTLRGVLLQPKQFSALNPYTSGDGTAFHRVMAALEPRFPAALRAEARSAAELYLSGERYRGILIDPSVCHYWSPVSMKPAGRKPPWASAAKWTFTPPGVDPARFIFAAGVP